MAFTDTDRRRLLMATTLTLLALPALWWANTSDKSTAPSVAVAGLDIGDSVEADGPQDPAAAQEAIDLDATSDPAPVFLNGPSAATGAAIAQVAVPAKPAFDHLTLRATYRSTITNAGTCVAPGLSGGLDVTVVNLNNGRSVRCTTVLAPGDGGELVLATSAFAEIADLTDAPIAVEIRR